MKKTGLIILGFGGHARSVADVAWTAGIKNICLVDPSAAGIAGRLGFRVERTLDDAPRGWPAIPASGDNTVRKVQLAQLEGSGRRIATLISPRATIGRGADIGPGTVVAHHAHVGPSAKIGRACIVNTGAVVEHDCQVGDYSHISVHSAVCGRTTLGEQVFVGAGAIVIDRLTVASGVTLGAGGTLVRSISKPGIYVGTPARLIEAKQKAEIREQN